MWLLLVHPLMLIRGSVPGSRGSVAWRGEGVAGKAIRKIREIEGMAKLLWILTNSANESWALMAKMWIDIRFFFLHLLIHSNLLYTPSGGLHPGYVIKWKFCMIWMWMRSRVDALAFNCPRGWHLVRLLVSGLWWHTWEFMCVISFKWFIKSTVHNQFLSKCFKIIANQSHNHFQTTLRFRKYNILQPFF